MIVIRREEEDEEEEDEVEETNFPFVHPHLAHLLYQ